ncbi:MAG TPA: hypothetical protein VK695_03600 [Steroidobacteraceae bacterium]|nr:hypothetical protein [Steroidobacteraceae bacterium]
MIIPPTLPVTKHRVVGGERSCSPSDSTDNSTRSIDCSAAAEEHPGNDGAGDAQKQIYGDAGAAAVAEPVSEGAGGNSDQNEDDD